MPFVRHKNNSRVDWGKNVAGNSNPDSDDIKLGCLMRIADATEAMAKRHTDLIFQRDYYERLALQRLDEIESLLRQRAALRGAVTRLKRAKAVRND